MTTTTIKWALAIVLALITVACVTINVYFPEAAAERAADRFIQDVIGAPTEEAGDAAQVPEATSSSLIAGVVNLLIPSAHAQQADIDIQTPQINQIRDRMRDRHQSHLAAWFDAGAIGLDNDGLVQVRDRSAVGLSERRELEQLVREENADRNAVYREIAVANGQPDWQDQIRDTFARRWVANARPGWYYQNAEGSWVQK
ncbi:MAG: YdbL family protein [Pseudomonadota bacterium]